MKISPISTAVRLVILINATYVIAKQWVAMVRKIAQLVREDRDAAKASEDAL